MALVKSEIKGEIRVIFLDAPQLIDQVTIDQCRRELDELLDKTEETHCVLHFGRVTFMSSAALGMLVRVHKKCKQYGVELKLCNISPEIREVFSITGLDKVFSIHPDAADALAAFAAGGQLFFRKRREKTHELE
jgi:anti-anti-sigma factor